MADRRPAVAEQPTERAQAFLRLADHHLDSAYRLARAILRDPTDAQDATHDAFEQAWRKWSTLRDPARFEQWFDRILVNTCRDRLRSGAPAGDGHLGRGRDLRGRSVRAGPRPRCPGQRDRDPPTGSPVVVALRYYRDLPVEEIASRLDIPAGTVQSRLHYALKRLHAAIDTADGKGTIR